LACFLDAVFLRAAGFFFAAADAAACALVS
jgi:hypothetical protein